MIQKSTHMAHRYSIFNFPCLFISEIYNPTSYNLISIILWILLIFSTFFLYIYMYTWNQISIHILLFLKGFKSTLFLQIQKVINRISDITLWLSHKNWKLFSTEMLPSWFVMNSSIQHAQSGGIFLKCNYNREVFYLVYKKEPGGYYKQLLTNYR